MKTSLKTTATGLIGSLLLAGSVSAASVTATDGGTAVYGACNGIAIDFDATAAPNAVWTPGLAGGDIYKLNSVAIKNASGNTGTYYLGVYSGFSGGVLSGFQGVSDNANNFATSPDNWLTFTFSNLNQNITVDLTVGSGSGMRYFAYQSGTSALTSPNVTLGTDKFGADTYMTDSLASVIAYGGLVANRSPQYQAMITPVIPMPPPAVPTGVSATASNTAVTLTWMTSSNATSYNVKRSLTSGGGYTTVAGVTGTNMTDSGLSYSTTYYYVVSALNSGGESTNSSEVSATTDGVPVPVAVTNSIGVSLVVGSNGVYQVNFVAPAWRFTGDLAQGLTNRTINTGTDNIGGYSEIAFNYTSAVPHSAGIRLYNNSPVVTFNDTTLAAGPNDLAFPHWNAYPSVPSHLTFGESGFGEFTFSNLHNDSPWLFFSTNHDTFIVSAATNYMVASTVMKSGSSISCGINSAIANLPSGFPHRAILVVQNGINQSYTTWGNALLALAGKTPPSNDAAVELNKIGYWTDNGSAYHYGFNPSTIASTLLSVNGEYASKGIQLGYMQLDSWFYEKGACQCWNDSNDGTYLYVADPTLFTNGLAAFQQQLRLPLFLHDRWIFSGSPYVSTYQMSGNVCIDPAYWTNIMAYVKSVGGCTYEQDWLSVNGTPLMNLNDGPAYLNNMQAAAAADGINLQYCMDQGRDFMQGSLYTNLMTVRCSYDAFDTNRWQAFLYGSRLVQAMGIWPWSDVYWSSATRNLLISTLSAGPVGPGDPLGSANATNLLKSVRPDGVIVKPDVPLVPVDDTYVNDSLGWKFPFVATTYSGDTNSRALYVFAYGENPANLSASFTPASFGISSNAYVYDYFAATGMVVNAGGAFNFTATMPNGTNGGSYFVAVPFGPSGMAFLGDTNKFVTRGKKRISGFSDTGLLRATVAFAAGETNVTLCGYAPSNPYVLALAGATNTMAYDSTTHIFTLSVSPGSSGTATVGLSLAPAPMPQIAPVAAGQFQIAWPAAAVGYVLEEATNLTPPVLWFPSPVAVTSTNGQNMVAITNGESAAFYRLRQ